MVARPQLPGRAANELDRRTYPHLDLQWVAACNAIRWHLIYTRIARHAARTWLLHCIATAHGDHGAQAVLSADGLHSLHGTRQPAALHGSAADQDGSAVVVQLE